MMRLLWTDLFRSSPGTRFYFKADSRDYPETKLLEMKNEFSGFWRGT